MEDLNREQNVERALSKEVANILERIDFDELKNIYVDQMRPVGVDPQHTGRKYFDVRRFIRREDISALPISDALQGKGGDSSKASRRIRINDDTTRLLAKIYEPINHVRAFFGRKPLSLERTILSLTCHEETHAVWPGYQEASGGGRFTFYELFNEGVTDLIAEEIYSEYLKRRSLSQKTQKDEEVNTDYARGYPEGRQMVDLFMDRIVESSGVQKDVVWKSLKSGYMLGLSLRSSEMEALMSEVFTPDVVMGLANAASASDNSKLIEKLRPDQAATVNRWWQKFIG